jgi:hypothetical protein
MRLLNERWENDKSWTEKMGEWTSCKCTNQHEVEQRVRDSELNLFTWNDNIQSFGS